MTIEEKLAYFSKLADEEAERERLRIQNDIDGKINEFVKTVTEDAEKKAAVRLRDESARIEQAKNKEIISASADSKKAVLNVRNRLTDTLFEGAAAKIEGYAKSREYRARLLNDIKASSARFSHVRVYLMERDAALASDLPENCGRLIVKDDFLGGFKLFITERNAIEDHTYLTLLKAAREDFNGLKIPQAADNGKEAGK